MMCKNPYMKGAIPCGCGQCLPCRLNRRRLWTHRMMLEGYMHENCSFATLTYDEENLPADGSLKPDDARKFLMRLRKSMYPRKLRFVLVGEYGDISERPHYHAALFGISLLETDLVRKSWGHGHVMLGDLTPDSAQYIAGYTVKKLTNKNNEWVAEKLKGRHPEFARYSLKPGIGAKAMEVVCDSLTSPQGYHLLNEGDVPSQLQHGQKKLPLGRYLKSKLREQYGFEKKETPPEVLQNFREEMHQLFQDGLKSKAIKASQSFKNYLIDLNKQKVLNLETRTKIFTSKKGKI